LLEPYVPDTGTGITWDAPVIRVYPELDEETLRWQVGNNHETIRDRYGRLLAPLPTIEKAELRIHRVDWTHPDANGYAAWVRLLVRGIRSDGSRAQIDQRSVLRVRQDGGAWRIARGEVTSRESVPLPHCPRRGHPARIGSPAGPHLCRSDHGGRHRQRPHQRRLAGVPDRRDPEERVGQRDRRCRRGRVGGRLSRRITRRGSLSQPR